MIFQHSQISKTVEVLNDLVKINNDRISGYQAALTQTNIDSDLRDAIYQIISEGQQYRHQLLLKIKQMDEEVKGGALVIGKIYTAWTALKVAFSNNTQKAIVASCMYNEEIALHAYRSALSNNGIPNDISQMISEHEKGLEENYNLLRCYRNTRQAAGYQLMYMA